MHRIKTVHTFRRGVGVCGGGGGGRMVDIAAVCIIRQDAFLMFFVPLQGLSISVESQ